MRRIKQISVTNLFSMFNHIIPLNMEDQITIIHGPNGIGKTAILRLINGLFGQSNVVLRTIPFNELRVDFDDGTSFWLTKKYDTISKEKGRKSNNPKIAFHFNDLLSEEKTYNLSQSISSIKLNLERTIPISMIDRVVPELDRIGVETWRHISSGDIFSFEDVIEHFRDRLPIEISYEKEPDWLKEIRRSLPIRFIETQRLLNPTKVNKRGEYDIKPSMVPTVTMYSEELIEIIKTKLAESTALSQSLDRTFPARLVSPTVGQRNVTDVELRARLAELEKKRSSLMDAGLVDQDSNDAVQVQVNGEFDPSTKTVLSVYVEDVEQKLGVFDELANKIDLLKRIINKRFLYKEMTISRKNGFVFRTSGGVDLSPTDLSSGEQHELVLFYELLFKATPGSLILIDEPEISLHVVWQEHFLNDIQEITQLANIDVLIATHSPDIINERRDLMVELEGPK